jgi:hypothetical protein
MTTYAEDPASPGRCLPGRVAGHRHRPPGGAGRDLPAGLPGRDRASAPMSRDFVQTHKDHEISDHGPSRGSARPPGPTRYSPVQSQGPNGQLLRPQSRHGTNPHRPHSWPGGCHWCPHTGHLGPSCFLATNRLSPAGRPRALDAGAGDRTDTAVFDLGWPLAGAVGAPSACCEALGNPSHSLLAHRGSPCWRLAALPGGEQ